MSATRPPLPTKTLIAAGLTLAFSVASFWWARQEMGTPAATISHRFRESLTKISATRGDILEVATLESDETLSRLDTRSLFGLIDLGTTVSEIKVPVVYRYHVKLSEEWNIDESPHRLRVIAPLIRPSLPPAFRSEGLKKRSEAGWLRFNAGENLIELEKSLTPLLKNRAAMPHKIDLVRAAARKSLAHFVQDWMKAPSGSAPRELWIYFRDETPRDD